MPEQNPNDDSFHDAESARRAARRSLTEERLTGVVKRLAATRDGLFFLRWLLTLSGALRADFPADSVRAAWDSGRRAIGLDLLRLVFSANEAANLLTFGDEHD